jgi:hypothetical protein
MRRLVNAVKRNSILTAVFVFALAASVGAAPQRGGGAGRSGGGHSSSGHPSVGHPGGGHPGGGQPHGHLDGRPHGHVGGPRGHFNGPHGHIIIGGGFYDPFYSYGYGYPYGHGFPYRYGYPGWPYDYSSNITGEVKTEITPKQAEVYVDGYYAGVADDFDGAFQRLYTSPGGHAVTFRLVGYRTVTRNIYVRPNSTSKLKETIEKLPPGEVSEPVPWPTLPTGRSDGMTSPPDGGSAPQR